MHWSVYVLVGAVINVLVNLGYKLIGQKGDILLIGAFVTAITSLVLFVVSFARGHSLQPIFSDPISWALVVMGVGGALVLFLFVTALSKGPISLVDPLWACIYALVSLAVGMLLVKETPSVSALAGIGLYLVGAFLMARG